jgi:hypothetical protein
MFYYKVYHWHQNKPWDINSPSGIWDICEKKTLPFLRWQNIDCDAINIRENENHSEFTIYPNPTSNILHIKTSYLNDPEIKLYTIEGQLLKQIRGTVIDMSTYPTGVYFIRVNGNAMKVVKM